MSWDRERALLDVVARLWRKLSPEQQKEYLPEFADVLWAIPHAERTCWQPDDLLTTAQVAKELGLKPAAIWNWPRRYGIKSVNGKWRWQDVKTVQLRKLLKHPPTAA